MDEMFFFSFTLIAKQLEAASKNLLMRGFVDGSQGPSTSPLASVDMFASPLNQLSKFRELNEGAM